MRKLIKSRQRTGQRLMFTLVEMLIVITVLFILLSLLTPTLRKALDSAQTIGCANNQKNIIQIVHNYAEDYSGYIHAENRLKVAGEPSGAEFFFMSIIQAYDQNIGLEDWGWWANSGPWNQSFICPADVNPNHKVNGSAISEYGRKSISYGVNQNCWYGNPEASNGKQNTEVGFGFPLRLERLARPSEIALGVDISLGIAMHNALKFPYLSKNVRFNTRPYLSPINGKNVDLGEIEWEVAYQNGSLLLRHNGLMGYNTFFIDGHVSNFKFPDYPESFLKKWNFDNHY
jgi:prepilin-type processing-associated H-X9-DG protein